MFERNRVGIVVALLILVFAVCMTEIPVGMNSDTFSGHADLSREYVKIESVPLYAAGTVPANTVDRDELTVLPGIGETIAAAWIAEYLENGDYHYPEDLLCVKGIGEKKLETLKPLLDISPTDR